MLYRAVALANSTGAIVEAYDTDAYGNTLIFTAPDFSGNWWSDSAVQSSYGANEIIYCGYRFDPETQLYYVRNRTYSPLLGRWLQRDPIGYSGGVNLYEYVGGRAVVAMDPTGRFCCSDQCSQGSCPRFMRITYRKRSCLKAWTGATGIEQGLKNFEKYFYLPGTILKWPVEPDIMPGVPIGAITGAGGGISNGLEKITGVYIEGTMEYETCELRPYMEVLTQWVWSQQKSPTFVFPMCVPDNILWVTWAEAWLLYVMRRGYFPILSAAICGH
ncbi:MAG: RHS repeat domain-containing protein [Phycisphaerae bacterium]